MFAFLFYNSAQLSNNLREIMQPTAFLCVICGRITRKRTQSIRTNEPPMSPADLADLRRQISTLHQHVDLPILSFSAK